MPAGIIRNQGHFVHRAERPANVTATPGAARTRETRQVSEDPPWLVVWGLGTVWILDGLEVTIVGSIAGRLVEEGSGLAITEAQIGQAAGIYVAGACLGVLFFGYLADRMGARSCS